MILADSLFAENDHLRAISKYDQVMQLSEKQNDWDHYLLAGFMKAQSFQKSGKLIKAIETSQKLIEIAANERIEPSKTLGDIWHKLGVYFYIEDEYNAAQNAYNQAIKVRKSLFGEKDLDLSRSYHNLGVAYFEKGNFEAAVENLRIAITIRKAHDKPVLLAQTYQELGIVSLNSGDYSKGLEYQMTALNIYKNQENPPLNSIARAHSVLGILNRKLANYPEAIQHFEKAKSIYIDLFGEKDSDVADSYNNIANVFDDLRQYKRAIENYQYALKINQALEGEESESVAQNYNNLGFTHTKMKEYEKALAYNEKALAIRLKLFGNDDPIVGNSYDNIGDVLFEKGDLMLATQYYQKALINMFADFRETNVLSNPDIEKHQLVGSFEQLLIFLSDKAKAFLKLYSNTKDQKILELAFELFQQCHKVINKMRQTYESDASILFLVENAIPIYGKGLETAYALNEIDPQEKYPEAAFHFMEKSKSVLLLSSRKEDKARWVAKIPKDLLSRESEFKADINYYTKRLNETQGNDSLATVFQNKLLLQKEDYQLFIAQLEQEYLAYFQEKYSNKNVEIKTLQARLKKLQSCLVEYFVGLENIYVIVLSEKVKAIFKIPLDFDFNDKMSQFLQALNDPNAEKTSSNQYAGLAYFLYKKIWKPIENSLVDKAIIVPDGLLNYLPFDALLTTETEGNNFKNYPYLIKKHEISYAYSASVLMDNYEVAERKRAKNTFLGVAPGFKNSTKFNYLPYSIEEVEKIQNYFGGVILIENQAIKNEFVNLAMDYKIIHISSHAAALDKNTSGSWIAFYESEADEKANKLYLSELYDLKLNAELVVLSACETSLGELSRGEGVMSLARGFAFSGCQSMVSTLWAVNHSATTQIFDSFYKYLDRGNDKSHALHQAKLNYLESDLTDQSSGHPYYWSAYLLVGNSDPLDIQTGSNWWIWFFGIGLICVLVFYFFKKQRIK